MKSINIFATFTLYLARTIFYGTERNKFHGIIKIAINHGTDNLDHPTHANVKEKQRSGYARLRNGMVITYGTVNQVLLICTTCARQMFENGCRYFARKRRLSRLPKLENVYNNHSL